jgi:competence protein ComGC
MSAVRKSEQRRPRPPAAVKGSNTAVVILLVIFGLLVGVAITGILAAIAIPNLLTAMQRAKQKRTMADIRSLGTALESYASDNNNTYPKVRLDRRRGHGGVVDRAKRNRKMI